MKKTIFATFLALILTLTFVSATYAPLDPNVVCAGADIVLESTMWVVGDQCHATLPTQASMNIDIPYSGVHEIFGIVQRGRPENPSQHQTGESFFLEIAGQQGPVAQDDTDPTAVTSRFDYLGQFNLAQGQHTLYMNTAVSCPPETSANSVHLHYVCVYLEEPEIMCHQDSDCDDQEQYTTDTCHNPGTQQSYCTNEPIPATLNIISPEARTYDENLIDIILQSNYPNIVYRVNSETSDTSYTNPIERFFSEGTHTLYASVQDIVGNTVSKQVTFTVELDDEDNKKKSNRKSNNAVKSNANPDVFNPTKSNVVSHAYDSDDEVINLSSNGDKSNSSSMLKSLLVFLAILAIILIILLVIISAVKSN